MGGNDMAGKEVVADGKGKEVSSDEKGKEVASDGKGKEAASDGKCKDIASGKKGKLLRLQIDNPPKRVKKYDHYKENTGPTHFCKIIFGPKLEVLQMLLDFTKYLVPVPELFRLTTNNGCTWKVTTMMIDGRLTLDKGWATFCVAHKVRIKCLLTLKLVSPANLKVIVFNNEGIEMMAKCGTHHKEYDMDTY